MTICVFPGSVYISKFVADRPFAYPEERPPFYKAVYEQLITLSTKLILVPTGTIANFSVGPRKPTSDFPETRFKVHDWRGTQGTGSRVVLLQRSMTMNESPKDIVTLEGSGLAPFFLVTGKEIATAHTVQVGNASAKLLNYDRGTEEDPGTLVNCFTEAAIYEAQRGVNVRKEEQESPSEYNTIGDCWVSDDSEPLIMGKNMPYLPEEVWGEMLAKSVLRGFPRYS